MSKFIVNKFDNLETPFYYYDDDLLKDTLSEINKYSNEFGYYVHYAIKANANPKVLKYIQEAGLGVDCVSGGEIARAVECGFDNKKIVFAGVGKTDKEINLALENKILCFNVESLSELMVINDLASEKNMIADVAVRINPNVDAHTHKYITTGLDENKFGVSVELLDTFFSKALDLKNIRIVGIHFHIGSQITDMSPYVMLCNKVNELQDILENKGAKLKIINVGGGLGVDYDNPDANPIPDFKSYFETFHSNLKLRPGQQVHFELGRSVVCQCGSLISRVTYVKEGLKKKFVILDAGMTELIRPALYQAHHKIENITSDLPCVDYDVVGPICESSDCFGQDECLNATRRGDFVALRSAGAYGEIMASQYNCRKLPSSYLASEI